MAVITFPLPTVSPTLYAKTFRWERYDQDITARGPFGVQSVSTIAPLWKVAMTFEMQSQAKAGPYQALLMQLDGVRNQLSLYNIGRPVPLGTYQGITGTNAITSASAGNTTMTITNATYATKTLLAGDYVGVGTGLTTQVVMVTADATSNGSGVINISFLPALRNAMTGTNATLQYPRALFRLQQTNTGWDYSTVVVDGMALDLLEDVRP